MSDGEPPVKKVVVIEPKEDTRTEAKVDTRVIKIEPIEGKEITIAPTSLTGNLLVGSFTNISTQCIGQILQPFWFLKDETVSMEVVSSVKIISEPIDPIRKRLVQITLDPYDFPYPIAGTYVTAWIVKLKTKSQLEGFRSAPFRVSNCMINGKLVTVFYRTQRTLSEEEGYRYYQTRVIIVQTI